MENRIKVSSRNKNIGNSPHVSCCVFQCSGSIRVVGFGSGDLVGRRNGLVMRLILQGFRFYCQVPLAIQVNCVA